MTERNVAYRTITSIRRLIKETEETGTGRNGDRLRGIACSQVLVIARSEATKQSSAERPDNSQSNGPQLKRLAKLQRPNRIARKKGSLDFF
jgi:hypothetical protein